MFYFGVSYQKVNEMGERIKKRNFVSNKNKQKTLDKVFDLVYYYFANKQKQTKGE